MTEEKYPLTQTMKQLIEETYASPFVVYALDNFDCKLLDKQTRSILSQFYEKHHINGRKGYKAPEKYDEPFYLWHIIKAYPEQPIAFIGGRDGIIFSNKADALKMICIFSEASWVGFVSSQVGFILGVETGHYVNMLDTGSIMYDNEGVVFPEEEIFDL